jgi:redox-regulated HSP33 family molecular chaperone
MSAAGSRARLYARRDCAVQLEHAGCRVSIVRCGATLQRALLGWRWPVAHAARAPDEDLGDEDEEEAGAGQALSADERRVVEEVLGPMVAATVLSNSLLKDDERTQGVLAVGAGGRNKLCMVEASRTGAVRARLPRAASPALLQGVLGTRPRPRLHLDTVRITYAGSGAPYVSSVALDDAEAARYETAGGHVVDALWDHSLRQSDQVPTALVTATRLAVGEDGRASVALCAGVLLQGLVGGETPPEQALADLLARLAAHEHAGAAGTAGAAGAAAAGLAAAVAQQVELLRAGQCLAAWWSDAVGQPGRFSVPERGEEPAEHHARAYAVDAFCTCSAERFAARVLQAVPSLQEQEALLTSGKAPGAFEATCEFCNTRHIVSSKVLDATRAKAAEAAASHALQG